jgi:hypothetical protein
MGDVKIRRRFRRSFFFFGMILIILLSITYAQEYGYRLSQDAGATVWWAEGAYKVMKDDPAPKKTTPEIRLYCARNEYEPFLLVLRPKQRLEDVRVEMGPFAGPKRVPLPGFQVSLCRVEYVRVTVPTDEFGRAGDWPDPLPPYDGPAAAPAGENQSFWVTVHVPAEAPAGEYRSSIRLSSGEWTREIPVAARVWDFALPKTSSIRSSFGIVTEDIKRYHNLETSEEVEQVTDLYYQNLRDHRLAPTSPFTLYPMQVKIKGLFWRGGEFTGDHPHAGRRALMIADTSVSTAVEAAYRERVPVTPDVPYALNWHARTAEEKQPYTVLIECFNAAGDPLPALNTLKVFEGSRPWKPEALEVSGFPPEAKTVGFRFFPAFRDELGASTGTAWFDDIVFQKWGDDRNLLTGGDMETDPEAMSVEVDFSEFDRAAERYLDEFGFNAFNLHLEGIGTGSFYSQTKGLFGGFRQGTPEYEQLLSQYLRQVEGHLEEKGWLGKEYIYWFDEPDPENYPFVRDGMTAIRRAAPRLTRFITEHKPGPDIMDVSEISCTIFHRVDPAVVAALRPAGREFWSYLCTAPKGPWVTLFIDHPAVNLRLWLWMAYRYGLRGLLVWRANYWTSPTVFPPDSIQNPWQDPMSYTVGYGTPYGQVNYWGNGDGRFLYPPNRDPNRDHTKYLCGPVNSVRWEILREGVEDYEYFRLLEKAVEEAPPAEEKLARKGRALLEFPADIFRNGQDFTKNPRVLLDYRRRLGETLEKLLAGEGKR